MDGSLGLHQQYSRSAVPDTLTEAVCLVLTRSERRNIANLDHSVMMS